ncbi:MAG: hypothetical protein IJ231_05210 [Clostridia bacterium]|nr:hypothetical protein [Clostridia bacterium]
MPRPVRRVVLDESHPRRRIIWILLSLAIAAGAFFAFFQGLLRVAPGWTAIPSEGRYAREITLRYELGAGEDTPASEQKKLQRIFTLALDQAGQALDASEIFEEPRNLAWLNAHPNVETEVSPILYHALETALSAGRWVYLGPLYEMNASLLASQSDTEAAQMDPRLGSEAADFVDSVLPFLSSPDQIHLQLLGGNTLRLFISPDYLALGEAYGISRWIDFGWTRNVFAADSVSDALLEAGADRGIVTAQLAGTASQDTGGTASGNLAIRALGGEAEIHLSLQGRENVDAVCASPAALLSLNAFQAGRRYADGTLRTPWLSLGDGLDTAAVEAVLAASRRDGCAGMLLRLLPVLTGEKKEPALSSGEETVWLLSNQTLDRYGDASLLK